MYRKTVISYIKSGRHYLQAYISGRLNGAEMPITQILLRGYLKNAVKILRDNNREKYAEKIERYMENVL